MNTVAHTPGPWSESDEVYNGDELAIGAEGGTVIGTAWSMGDDAEGRAVQIANQRLMAASPELFAVAIDALTYLSNVNTFEPEDVPLRIIAVMKKLGMAAPEITSIIGTACAKPGREKINDELLASAREMLAIIEAENPYWHGRADGADGRARTAIANASGGAA